MSEVSSGHAYFTETDYEVFNIFPGMCPAAIRFAGLMTGIKTPDFEQSFDFLDLGCGQGFASNAYAAVYPSGRFVGVDMAEGAILGARKLAEEAGLNNIRFEVATFADFARNTTQKFDVIGLHGIWTWVGMDVREDALEILRTLLKPGGVVYISTNSAYGRDQAKPAHALLMAMRRAKPDEDVADLMKRFGDTLKQNPTILENAPRAKAFLEFLINGSPNFFSHEYLSSAWSPVSLADLAADLARADLSFLASANPWTLNPSQFINEPHRSFVEAFSDPIDRATAYDALMGTEFRTDLFIKGPQVITPEEQRQMVLATPLAFKNKSRLQLVKDGRGEVARIAANASYSLICERLLQGPCTIGEALSGTELEAIDTQDLLDSLHLLKVVGAVSSGIGAIDDPEIRARAQRFNAAALAVHASLNGTTPLISPVCRGPVTVSIIDSIAIRAEKEPIDPVATLLKVAAKERVSLQVDGVAVEDAEAVAKSYRRTFAAWPLVRRPALASLGILS